MENLQGMETDQTLLLPIVFEIIVHWLCTLNPRDMDDPFFFHFCLFIFRCLFVLLIFEAFSHFTGLIRVLFINHYSC